MNNLSRLILLGGRENESLPAGIFYRMGMPSSRELTYDLVTCTHSLLDLPDEKTRLTTVDKLWRKTGGYLVLIENGTNAGFQVRKGKKCTYCSLLELKYVFLVAQGPCRG